MSEFLPGEDPNELTDSTPLISGGILDSIATLKLVMFMEERFKRHFEAARSQPRAPGHARGHRTSDCVEEPKAAMSTPDRAA
jgi:hypothetical protein